MIAGKPKAGNTPARDITEFEVAACSENLGQRGAACIGCAEDTADAGAGDVRDGNVVLFEDLQDA